MTGRKKFWLKFSVATGALVLLVGFAIGWSTLVFVGECQTSLWPSQKFEVQAWRASSREQRYVFARDIVDNGVFLGKNTDAIRTSLGDPDYISDSYVDYVVRVFADGGCGLSSLAVLRLHLGKDGKAKEISITYD